jgi:hypothetical protein
VTLFLPIPMITIPVFKFNTGGDIGTFGDIGASGDIDTFVDIGTFGDMGTEITFLFKK